MRDHSLHVSDDLRAEIIDAFLDDLGSKVYAGARKWSQVQREYWQNPSPFTPAQVEAILSALIKQYGKPSMVPRVQAMLQQSQQSITGAEAIQQARALTRGVTSFAAMDDTAERNAEARRQERAAAKKADPPRKVYTATDPGICPTCHWKTVITRNGVDKCEACEPWTGRMRDA